MLSAAPCTCPPRTGRTSVGLGSGFQAGLALLSWLHLAALFSECSWGPGSELREGILSGPFPRADSFGAEVGTGACLRRVGVSRTQACHSFPCPGTQETPLSAVFWGQRVSLRYKRAVCLQLKFVVVFFCPSWLVRGTRGYLCCPLMHGSWVTAVFQSAAPFPPWAPSQHRSLPWLLHSRVAQAAPASLQVESGLAERDLFWRVSVKVSRASLAMLRLRPRIPVCRAGGPQVSAPSPTPGAPGPHTRSRTLRSFHPLLSAPEHARAAPSPRVRVISARRPPRPQQWIS